MFTLSCEGFASTTTSSSPSPDPDLSPSAYSASLRSALLFPAVIPRESRDLLLSAPLRPSTLNGRLSTPSFPRVRISIIPWNLRFLCFHTLTHSFALRYLASPFLSAASTLFAQNTRRGYPAQLLPASYPSRLAGYSARGAHPSLPRYLLTSLLRIFTDHGPPAKAHV